MSRFRISWSVVGERKWKGRKVGNFWISIVKDLVLRSLTVLKEEKEASLKALEPLGNLYEEKSEIFLR